MGAVEYKMFFDGTAATVEQLDKIDDITVDQAVDRAWEARIKIPVCVNNDGKWEGEEEAWMKAFTRIRVEVNAGDGKFVPLIDGPVVGFDSARSSQPGKSVVTVVVHDDSALLNREARVEVQQGRTDSEIAEQIFSEAQLGGVPQIESTPPQPDETTNAAVRRGTPMQYLRDLARRNQDWHAYVLPGLLPSQSIGCFKKFPTDTDGLPDMNMMGADRNIENFNVNNRAASPTSVQAATLSLDHGAVRTATSSYRDATLLGDQPPDATNPNQSTSFLPPGQSDRVDIDHAVAGAAALSGFALEATGNIVPFCYPAALSPYRWVMVKISDSQFSTKYLITQVKHTLTRSIYTQNFSMKGNAVSAGASSTASSPQPSASLSVSFNVQVSIF
ncbi:MAG TPA: hypothetical protein VKA78_06380 [Pyrinomonadaceae bacterium]|nr:hypothetical protein [Pyrinomonadaceae bacterium]